jgi:hypothetical protein
VSELLTCLLLMTLYTLGRLRTPSPPSFPPPITHSPAQDDDGSCPDSDDEEPDVSCLHSSEDEREKVRARSGAGSLARADPRQKPDTGNLRWWVPDSPDGHYHQYCCYPPALIRSPFLICTMPPTFVSVYGCLCSLTLYSASTPLKPCSCSLDRRGRDPWRRGCCRRPTKSLPQSLSSGRFCTPR